jgi:y4mF family transcriptional regulator
MRYTILSKEMKALRKAHGLTQEDLALKTGVGLRFVRELEQGKRTLRMDKVNQVFELFGMQLAPVKIPSQSDPHEEDR